MQRIPVLILKNHQRHGERVYLKLMLKIHQPVRLSLQLCQGDPSLTRMLKQIDACPTFAVGQAQFG